MDDTQLSFTLNGQRFNITAAPNIMLADLLREKLGLKGIKIGCREGECGACTVLINGDPVNACILPAMKVAGQFVTTIEGLAKDNELDPIQQAFINEGAIQCGFCTPAMILSAKALLDRNPNPSESEIKENLSGVLCRCTGYTKIFKAVKTASEIRKSLD
jgi:aerobic-type carbon monoxide dehydrogenase small subunit (CoxS/CutS family)